MNRAYVHDGLRLLYEDRGDGPPVLFVHAFPLSGAMWRSQVEALAPRHRCLVAELRGFGGSEVGGQPSAMEILARDLTALLDDAGVESATVCGLSMGGYVALALVEQAPARVAALVLADTRAGADTPQGRDGRRALAEEVRREGSAALVPGLVPKLLSQRARREQPEVVGFVEGEIRRAPPAAVAAAALGMAARPDRTPGLSAIAAPTLVVVGEEDVLTPPAESEAMAAAIPASRLVRIQGAGHLANLERPREFTAALDDFVRSVPSRVR